MRSNDEIRNSIEAFSARELTELEDSLSDNWYLEKLNIGQKIAATRKEGNFLVIAGPGTGKTHTLAYRVLHMIKTGTDLSKVVVITFTRKAGNELKYRINQLMPNTELGFVGTFHGFANHISQMNGKQSPISKFRLLDAEDDRQVHSLVMTDYRGFSKPIRAGRIQKLISYCVNTDMTPQEYIKKFDLRNLMDDGDAIEAYRKVYERYKVEHMLANYDDMILKISHFMDHKENRLPLPYKYLMIDEYQDTNKMQLDFIKKLNIPNVMAIGDDFQGIYSFRGADHKIILNFYRDFEDAKMIKLTRNYRSVPEIVNRVNQTVEASKLGYQKVLISAKDMSGYVEVVPGNTLESHRDFVISKIKEKPEESHALIYRYNKHRTVFEKALINEGIDYAVYGGVRLLERKHIKDVLAFLMVYLNRRDVVSYNRILTIYPGIGPKTAKRLMKYELKDTDRLNDEKTAFVGQVRDILTTTVNKDELLSLVIKLYMSIYDLIESDYYTVSDVKDDFQLLTDLLQSYESLENFIINLILDPVVDLKKGKNPKVILTTIHSAKGLEFENVYYFHSHDWYKNYDLEQTEEDRRLFYVGISRAKNNLYVFDHTDVPRPFESILKDFEKIDMASVSDDSSDPEEANDVETEKDEKKEQSNVIKVDFGSGKRK
ncbi:ATP-dependent helicase [Vallitalea pronyensis]|uniref:DNA 3'-5' helicase n=1 Tax=Vallitalea pronyensis TaxID=1348613 RepID=A0A8J8MPL5_9FIRM|nr:ATP-dependent helicase [Vallitalea pronyensis]QUI25396.1 ATP-dependent helicase [Vallitalea pronyensis]